MNTTSAKKDAETVPEWRFEAIRYCNILALEKAAKLLRSISEENVMTHEEQWLLCNDLVHTLACGLKN